MIVICTRCQAKFRVADEKIGPRGAKLRCSRCQNVFLVHPDVGSVPLDATGGRPPAPAAGPTPPAPEFDLEPRRPAAARQSADPFAPAPDPFAPAAASVPPPVGSPAGAAAADPFAAFAAASAPAAASTSDPFAAGPSPGGAPAHDPFAALSGPPAPAASSLGFDGEGGAAVAGSEGFADDPFGGPGLDAPAPAPSGGLDAGAALAQAADPFAAVVSPRSASAGVPVTDLSDLLGVAPSPAPPGSGPPPLPGPASAGSSAFPVDPGEIDFGDPGGGPDLALEDRDTPAPVAARAPPAAWPANPDELPEPDLDAATPGPAALAPSGPAVDDAPLKLATETTDPPIPVAPSPARAAPPQPRPAAARPDLNPAPDRIPGARSGRLRTIAVNAVALAVLLVVALAIRVAWRGDAAAAGRPGAPRGAPAAEPFVPSEVTSGQYERAQGAPLLFVKGKVLSRAPAEVRAVQVEVEVVRDGRVLARGTALAGAVPSPEELHGASDGPGLEALAASLAARAPAAVRPGDAVPFLVAIAGAPADLSGATLRIVARAGAAP